MLYVLVKHQEPVVSVEVVIDICFDNSIFSNTDDIAVSHAKKHVHTIETLIILLNMHCGII